MNAGAFSGPDPATPFYQPLQVSAEQLLGPEKSPNSPPPGVIVHPSLHDNTRHWRLTRLSSGEKGQCNPSPTGRPTPWLSTLSALSRMGRFMNIFVARWNSPGGLLCLMTLLCRKWKFRKKKLKAQPNWAKLGGRSGRPGFYDILNGNRAASNILRSDKIFGTRTYLLIFSILRVCDCNIVVWFPLSSPYVKEGLVVPTPIG